MRADGFRGLPQSVGLTSLVGVSFDGEEITPLDATRGMVRTVSRAQLGTIQAEWARKAGAEIVSGREMAR